MRVPRFLPRKGTRRVAQRGCVTTKRLSYHKEAELQGLKLA